MGEATFGLASLLIPVEAVLSFIRVKLPPLGEVGFTNAFVMPVKLGADGTLSLSSSAGLLISTDIIVSEGVATAAGAAAGGVAYCVRDSDAIVQGSPEAPGPTPRGSYFVGERQMVRTSLPHLRNLILGKSGGLSPFVQLGINNWIKAVETQGILAVQKGTEFPTRNLGRGEYLVQVSEKGQILYQLSDDTVVVIKNIFEN